MTRQRLDTAGTATIIRADARTLPLADWRTNDRDQLAKVLGVAKAVQQDEYQEPLFG